MFNFWVKSNLLKIRYKTVVFGVEKNVELIENGRNIIVTDENKK